MSDPATGRTTLEPGIETDISDGLTGDEEFRMFYERRWDGAPMSVAQRILVCFLLGAAFFAGYYLAAGADVFAEWTWMVAVMLVAAPMCLYLATTALRKLLPHLDRRVSLSSQATYRIVLSRLLSNRRMAVAGVFFGLVNCGMGYAFGPPAVTSVGTGIPYYGGLFLLGFVCGMAAYGIYGIIRAIDSYFAIHDVAIDFTAPDRCGGLRVLGQAIVKFAAVTLFMGVLIALYIALVTWEKQDVFSVQLLMAFWVVFPFLLSLTVLIVPAIAAHDRLTEFKERRDFEMQQRLVEMRRSLSSDTLPHDEREALYANYTYHVELREELFRMRTWPFSTAQGMEYASFLIANGFVSIPGIQKITRFFG